MKNISPQGTKGVIGDRGNSGRNGTDGRAGIPGMEVRIHALLSRGLSA